jgi:hypothetical protein
LPFEVGGEPRHFPKKLRRIRCPGSEILQQVVSLAKAAYLARTAGSPKNKSPIVTSEGDPSAMPLLTAAEHRLREFLKS